MGSDIVTSSNGRILGERGSVSDGNSLVAIFILDDGNDDLDSGSDTAKGAHIPRKADSVGLHLQSTACT